MDILVSEAIDKAKEYLIDGYNREDAVDKADEELNLSYTQIRETYEYLLENGIF